MTNLLSDRGCALITGVAILENGQALDLQKPNLLTLDAHIYLPTKFGSAPNELLAVIRFYAHSGHPLLSSLPDVGYCFVHVLVSKLLSHA